MDHEPAPRFDFDYEVEPAESWPVETPISAAAAAMHGAHARWVTEFRIRYEVGHPDLVTPEQAAQEVRVADEIRRMFRTLTPSESTDPDALANTRARAAALISRELGLDPPVTLRESPEERSLRDRRR